MMSNVAMEMNEVKRKFENMQRVEVYVTEIKLHLWIFIYFIF